jgi:hypothetical protein
MHIVLQYTPAGPNFRDKINRHKDLLTMSQMIFMQDLPACELEQLGMRYLHKKDLEAKEK